MIKVGGEYRHSNPTHHVSLSDGETTIGLIVSDNQGNANYNLINRMPAQRTAVKTYNGSAKYSDFVEPWSPVAQDDWSGGRGQDDFEKDTTRYHDGKRANTTLSNKLFCGPRDVYSSGYRSQNFNLPGSVKWYSIIDGDKTYLANQFTTGGAYSAKYIYLHIKRVGTPATALTISLCSNNGGNPGAVLQSTTVTTSNITDILSEFYRAEITTQALSGSTLYWVKVSSSGDDENHWQVGVNDAAGTSFESADGTLWESSLLDLYYRITDADDSSYYYKFFQYRRSQYLAISKDGSAPKVYINGDRGSADANTGALTTLVDATKSWTTNEWAGCVVLLISGTGSTERTAWRKIASNTGTTLTLDSAWLITHDTTTDYVILGSDKWTEVTGHGLTAFITDVFVYNNICYFCQGDGVAIRRMRWYNNSGTATYDWADDSTNKAVSMTAVKISTGYEIWKSNNKDANGDVSIAKASVVAWGTNLTFGTAIAFKDQWGKINTIAEYGTTKELWIMREGSVFYLDPTKTVPEEMALEELHTVMEDVNGRATLKHNVYLYFNVGYGLQRYYNQTLDDIGPNRSEGLPSDRQGYLSAMLGYPGMFFASVESSGYSSIICNSGSDYWHEVYRSPVSGLPIRGMGFQAIPGDTSDRLWFNIGNDICWLYFPSKTVNPLSDTNYRYTHEAVLETSYVYVGLVDLQKYFYSIKVFAENLSDDVNVKIQYKVDDDTAWTSIEDLFTETPVQENKISENFGVRGKRIRLRIILSTDDWTTSPIVKSVVIENISAVTVKNSYSFPFRMREKDIDLLGNPDEFSSNEKRTVLDEWASNVTPLIMRCNDEQFDNIQCFINPLPIYPIAENSSDFYGKLTVMEV